VTEKQFVVLVREYAVLARKRNRSYAEMVLHLRDVYVGGLSGSDRNTPEIVDRAAAWANDFIFREYSPADPGVLGQMSLPE
jgi:hypothetical protein